MIEGEKYIEVVKEYFGYLITEFGFKVLEEMINGNYFYRVRYIGNEKVISISYENIEDYLLVIVFMLQNGELPNYDDKTKTLHLNKLNAQVLSKVDKNEIILNSGYFAKFETKDELERKLLKGAKELQ